MKKISIIALLFIYVLSFGQGINFEHAKFAELLGKAKKENKLIFVDAYAEWCGPCKMMVKNIFPLKSVGDLYNASFINTKIDMEKGEGVELAKKYKVQAYPTYLFVNGDGEVVHRVVGYVEEKDFIQFGKDAQNPEMRIGMLKKKFENGEKNPQFLQDLANKLMFTEPEYSEKVLIVYYKSNPITPQNFQSLMVSIQSADSPLYQIYKDRKEEITKFVPENQYNQIGENVLLNALMQKSVNKQNLQIDEETFMKEGLKFMTKEQTETKLKGMKASIALKKNDIAAYEKLTLENFADYTKKSTDQLNSEAWNFFEKVSTKSSLETAVKWALESVKKEEGYANSDTVANLYLKLGDKKNAKLWAEKAIELAKKEGQDYADTQKVLDAAK